MSTVTLEQPSEAVRIIRLDRPERLNAITFELVGDLHDALDTVAGDESCKVAVLTGAGRGFCAGLDLKDFGTPPSAGEHPHYPAGTTGQSFMANLTQHIRATPQIVVAAVNGPAYGGGLSLVVGVRPPGRGAFGHVLLRVHQDRSHRHRHRRHLPPAAADRRGARVRPHRHRSHRRRRRRRAPRHRVAGVRRRRLPRRRARRWPTASPPTPASACA